jgi:hypothetical protein
MLQLEYAHVSPPDGLEPIDPATTPPISQWVDYGAHPAYRDLIGASAWTDRARAMWRFARQAVVIAGKRVIRYEMIPVSVRRPKTARSLLSFAAAAARNMLPARKQDLSSSPLSQALREQGCIVSVVPAAQFARIEALAAPAFRALDARRAQSGTTDREFDESRAYSDRRSNTALFDEIASQLDAAGILAAASDYLGRPAQLVDINPQINDRSDSFWRKVFPDLQLKAVPPSAYFHRDASGGDLKAIIYMTAVDDQNGPFTYCVGSNRLRPSRIPDLICETNDSNGLSSTDPKLRRIFASLPRRLRLKGAFGNDVTEGSLIEARLLQSAWAITGPAGAIVLFDTKGIHRGGMVEKSERRVITCVIG